MFFLRSAVFLRKKSPRQGCTKPKTELGMHQNPYSHKNQLKINKNQKINPPSTITIPESGQYGLPHRMSLKLVDIGQDMPGPLAPKVRFVVIVRGSILG